jgi:hypothetical protein
MSTTDRTAASRAAIAATVALLSCLPLLGAALIHGLPVTRTSLDGYTLDGRTLDLEEAAHELATLQGRVRAALRAAGRRLRSSYMHEGRFQVAYRDNGNGRLAAFITIALAGEDISTREEKQAVIEVVDALREALLAAAGNGRLQATALLF